MKRSKQERRTEAIARLKQSIFENSRAKRNGSLTKEEWQARKDAEIAHLEENSNVRKTS